MGTVRQAIAVLQTHAITAGAREAPTDPPEGNAGFPFSICYPDNGTIFGESSGARRDIINLVLDYHLSRQNLPLNVQAALSFLETFPSLLVGDPTLGATVDTIILDTGISFNFGKMEYGSLQTIGFRFTIPIKIRRAV